MINISRTKFCVLNVAKSEIISHLKLSSADMDLKQTGQLFDLIRPRCVLYIIHYTEVLQLDQSWLLMAVKSISSQHRKGDSEIKK